MLRSVLCLLTLWRCQTAGLAGPRCRSRSGGSRPLDAPREGGAGAGPDPAPGSGCSQHRGSGASTNPLPSKASLGGGTEHARHSLPPPPALSSACTPAPSPRPSSPSAGFVGNAMGTAQSQADRTGSTTTLNPGQSTPWPCSRSHQQPPAPRCPPACQHGVGDAGVGDSAGTGGRCRKLVPRTRPGTDTLGAGDPGAGGALCRGGHGGFPAPVPARDHVLPPTGTQPWGEAEMLSLPAGLGPSRGGR